LRLYTRYSTFYDIQTIFDSSTILELMEQEDYLKRQIDQLSRILGKILSGMIGLKNQGQISESIEMTNQTLKKELELDIQELIDIKTDNFIKTLKSEKDFTDESLDKLAEILLVIADSRQDGDRKKVYLKCLTIYEYLEKVENTYSIDRQMKIAQIKNML
jgi:hypothetical protein